MDRRKFLDWLMGIAGTTLGGLVLYPVVRYLIPPKVPEAVSTSTIAAKVDELAPNSFKIFRFGGLPGILIRTSDGEYRAFSAVCTHLDCTVQFKPAEHSIWCACHDGVYNLEGINVSGPPPRPLERYDVHMVGEDIVVEKMERA